MQRTFNNPSHLNHGDHITAEKEGGNRYVADVFRSGGMACIQVEGKTITVASLITAGFKITMEVPDIPLPRFLGAVIRETHENGSQVILLRAGADLWNGTDGRVMTDAQIQEHIVYNRSTIELLEPRMGVIKETIQVLRELDRDKASNKAWADLLAHELGVDA